MDRLSKSAVIFVISSVIFLVVAGVVASLLIFVFHIGGIGIELEPIDVTPQIVEISPGDPEKTTVDLGQEFGQFINGASGLTPGIKGLEPFVQSDICGTFVLTLAGWQVEEISVSGITLVYPDGDQKVQLVLGPETTFQYFDGGPPVEISAGEIHTGDKVSVYIRWQKMYESMKPFSQVIKWAPALRRETKPIKWTYMGSGTVEKINGRALTIREKPYYQGDGRARLDIFVAEDVVIRRISLKEGQSKTESGLESIEIGDAVSFSGYFSESEGLVINEITLY